MRRPILFLLAALLSASVHAQLVRPGEWVVRRADEGVIQEKDLAVIPTKILDARGEHDFAVFARYERVMGIRTDREGAEFLKGRGFTVEPNYQFKLLGWRPSALKEGETPWHLRRIGERANSAGAFNLLPASGGVAYVLDTYAYDTEDGAQFEGRLVRGPDFVGGSDADFACRFHGTAMADLIHQVNPAARIVTVRVGGCDETVSWLAVQGALDWMADHGAALYGTGPVNMSFGGSGFTQNPLAKQLARLKPLGFVMVAAAANESHDAGTVAPCRYSDICVGASDEEDRRVDFSNFGPAVSIFAPGKDVLFTAMTLDGTGTAVWSGDGTSASTPLAVGVWTLLHGTFPALSPARITALLLANATKGDLGDIGAGSPNLLLYAGSVVEQVGTNFFRYIRSDKKFSARVQLGLNGGVTQSATVAFYRGGKGTDGHCQGKPYAQARVDASGFASVAVTGWSIPPAKGCFQTELGLVSERQVTVLP
ncbi:MAG TPA: S8 family serine peptidase [Thermoanaerobaculia bacterium]